MRSLEIDKVFAGSIPELYDTYLVPMLFESYAADLAVRLAGRPLVRVLEIAAGTGSSLVPWQPCCLRACLLSPRT